MKYDIRTDNPLTDAACKEATGRTLKQWFDWLDGVDALKIGRRESCTKIYEDTGISRGSDWWVVSIAVEYELARAPKKKDGLAEGYGICVTKSINAPLDALWSAWTAPAQLSKWFGPGFKLELKDGGAWSNKDGDQGSFLRVREGKDLRFSFENPALSSASTVDVVPTAKGEGKSHVMLNHTRIQTRAEADGLRRGWGSAFDALKKLLEA